MKSHSKRITVLLFVVVVAVIFSFPITNLVAGLPSNSLTALEIDEPAFREAAAVLGTKCANCHSTEPTFPFYASFPIAKGLIEADVREGTRHMNYAHALTIEEGNAVSEVVLAKTEQTIIEGDMPPKRYIALHWNGGLTSAERATLLTWISKTRAEHYATGTAAPAFANDAVQPLPARVDLDPRKVALGDKLFHDKRLSTDNSLACAGCHALDKGGTDQRQFSEGVGQQLGGINAPTVYNSGYQFVQFWDGRAADLEEQADGPVNNPIEMASSWSEAIPKLEQDVELTAAFQEVYLEGYSKDTITNAIAVFEQSLITPNSRFDKYLTGQPDALSPEEKGGYELFKEFNCATCHVGKILGGQSFEIMGLKADYFSDRGNVSEADYGRFNVTNREEDRFKLKTPTLRNIALTYPYLHDGSTSDLSEVVRIMAKYQVGRAISQEQTTQIAAFLKTLTGKYNGEILQ